MRYLWLTLVFVLIASSVLGATATVSGVDNPPTTFANIRDAVEYLKANFANQANVVNVTTDGPIVETGIIDISTSCTAGFTINGDADANTVACTLITSATTAGSQGNFKMPFSSNYAALYIGGANATYTIQDLILQPAFIAADSELDSTLGTDGVRGLILDDFGPAGYTINVNNVTVGGSKAGNVLAADPNVNEWALCTRYHRNNIWSPQIGGATTSNTIHLTRFRAFNMKNEGLSLDGDHIVVDMNEGCVFAWSGEHSIAVFNARDCVLTMDGTASDRILIRGSGQDDADEEGLCCNGPNAATIPFSWLTMTYTDLIEAGGENEMGRHCGPVLMDNCFIALTSQNNDDADGSDTGLRYGYNNSVIHQNGTRTIQNCTIYDDVNPAGTQYGLNFTGNPDGITVNLSNVIIAGAGDDALYLRDGGDSVMNLSDSALVTAGPDALSSTLVGTADGPGTGNWDLNQTNITNADPEFDSTTYTYGSTADFLRVTNAAYNTAGPASGELTGAGGPIGPKTRVQDWPLY